MASGECFVPKDSDFLLVYGSTYGSQPIILNAAAQA